MLRATMWINADQCHEALSFVPRFFYRKCNTSCSILTTIKQVRNCCQVSIAENSLWFMLVLSFNLLTSFLTWHRTSTLKKSIFLENNRRRGPRNFCRSILIFPVFQSSQVLFDLFRSKNILSLCSRKDFLFLVFFLSSTTSLNRKVIENDNTNGNACSIIE